MILRLRCRTGGNVVSYQQPPGDPYQQQPRPSFTPYGQSQPSYGPPPGQQPRYRQLQEPYYGRADVQPVQQQQPGYPADQRGPAHSPAVHTRIHPLLPHLPRPVRPAATATAPRRGQHDLLATGTEVLALSKMNWNNAQLDERDPLTLRTAHRVGAILRHVPPDAQIATRYAYYM